MALAVSMALEPGCWNNAIAADGRAVEPAVNAVIGGRQLDARDVPQPGDLAVGLRLEHDVSKLFRRHQPPFGHDRQLEQVAGRLGRLAEQARRHLHVLPADGGDDVARGQIARGGLVRINPDAHAVVPRAEDDRVAHARQPGQHVPHVQIGVVAQIDRVVFARRRNQAHQHGDGGRALAGGHPQRAHFLRHAAARRRPRGSAPAPAPCSGPCRP